MTLLESTRVNIFTLVGHGVKSMSSLTGFTRIKSMRSPDSNKCLYWSHVNAFTIDSNKCL